VTLPADRLAELNRQMHGTLTGIGAQLRIKDGKPVVVTPLEDSPARPTFGCPRLPNPSGIGATSLRRLSQTGPKGKSGATSDVGFAA
jgi:hypothetical protein